MSAKIIFVFAQALFVQSALSQCTSRAAVAAGPGIAAPALGYGLAPYGMAAPSLAAPYGLASCGFAAPAMDFTPTSGGGLSVTSASAIAPVGLSVTSENLYEGILTSAGELPFVGTVAVEGVLPTAGAGAINHACGNGINAMVAETTALAPGYLGAVAPATGISPAATIAPGLGTPSWAAVAASPGIAAPALGYGLELPALAAPYDLAAPCGVTAPALDFTPTSGGGLPVSSASATAPVGLSVASENVYEGVLAAAGELPFVGTVAVEGILPTAGAGAVNHACGNGINAMAAETTAFAPSYLGAITPAAAAIAPGLGAPALGYAGWAGRGCGYAF